jgi:hypothetical protein
MIFFASSVFISSLLNNVKYYQLPYIRALVVPQIVFPKGGKSPQCTRFSFKKNGKIYFVFWLHAGFFVISQSNRFIVNQEDDTLDILNVMGPSVSNYFFLRELKNLFSVPSVFLRSNALFLDPSTNLSESTCELSRENLPVIPPRSFPTGSPSYPSRETFPISPRAPLSAQPPGQAHPAKPHLLYHGHAATPHSGLHTGSAQDTGSSGKYGQPEWLMQVLPVPGSGIAYAGF